MVQILLFQQFEICEEVYVVVMFLCFTQKQLNNKFSRSIRKVGHSSNYCFYFDNFHSYGNQELFSYKH